MWRTRCAAAASVGKHRTASSATSLRRATCPTPIVKSSSSSMRLSRPLNTASSTPPSSSSSSPPIFKYTLAVLFLAGAGYAGAAYYALEDPAFRKIWVEQVPGGQAALEQVAEAVEFARRTSVADIQTKANDTVKTVTKTADEVKGKVVSQYEKTLETINAVKHTAESGYEATVKKVHETQETAQQKIENISAFVSSVNKEAQHKLELAQQKVKEAELSVKGLAHNVGNTLETTKEKIEDVYESVHSAVTGEPTKPRPAKPVVVIENREPITDISLRPPVTTKESVSEKVASSVETAKDKVVSSAEAAKAKATSSAEAAKDKVAATAESAKEKAVVAAHSVATAVAAAAASAKASAESVKESVDAATKNAVASAAHVKEKAVASAEAAKEKAAASAVAVKEKVHAAEKRAEAEAEHVKEQIVASAESVKEKAAASAVAVAEKVHAAGKRAEAEAEHVKEKIVASAESVKEKAAASAASVQEKTDAAKAKTAASAEAVKDRAAASAESLKDKVVASVESVKQKAMALDESVKERVAASAVSGGAAPVKAATASAKSAQAPAGTVPSVDAHTVVINDAEPDHAGVVVVSGEGPAIVPSASAPRKADSLSASMAKTADKVVTSLKETKADAELSVKQAFSEIQASFASIPGPQKLVTSVTSLATSLGALMSHVGDEGKEKLETARMELVAVTDYLKTLDAEEAERLKSTLQKQAAKYAETLKEHISVSEQALLKQASDFENKFGRAMEDERERLIVKHNTDLAEKLSQQAAEFKAALERDLATQRAELEKHYAKEIKHRIDKERDGRLARLDHLALKVKRLEHISLTAGEHLARSTQIHQLRNALDALTSVLDQPIQQPITKQVNILRSVADDNITASFPLVTTVLDSLSPDTVQSGVPTLFQLEHRFKTTSAAVRQAQFMPPDGGPVAHIISTALSAVTFQKRGLVNGDDVEAVLARTQHYLTLGDVDAAAREMNQLKGWPRTLATDWLHLARKYLEVRQAVEVVQTHLSLLSLDAV
ncbi:mitochondrial inner membrane protein-domain-containing protein [Powellomyces hirtus]|nr:mitochondrial inner membrane protein-domain-containing protein [Powellomyces hirtus]